VSRQGDFTFVQFSLIAGTSITGRYAQRSHFDERWPSMLRVERAFGNENNANSVATGLARAAGDCRLFLRPCGDRIPRSQTRRPQNGFGAKRISETWNSCKSTSTFAFDVLDTLAPPEQRDYGLRRPSNSGYSVTSANPRLRCCRPGTNMVRSMTLADIGFLCGVDICFARSKGRCSRSRISR
jgi:hypothetical protein